MKDRAFAGRALCPQVSPVLFDYSVAYAEAEPGPLAHFLGREERVEDLLQVLLRDARPVVGDT